MASLLSLGAVLDAADFIPNFAGVRGIFCGLAWISTALAMVLTIASLFSGVDADGDGDLASVDSDTGDGDVGIFSLRAIIGFFLGFGWGGFIAAASGGSALVSTLCALGLGVLMFFIVAFLIRAIYSLKSEHVFDAVTLIGKTGTVYVTIPAKGEAGRCRFPPGSSSPWPLCRRARRPSPRRRLSSSRLLPRSSSPSKLFTDFYSHANTNQRLI